MALVDVTLPMYFLQLGMQRLHPLTTMMRLSLVPVVTYIFEFSLGKTFNPTVLGLLLISVMLAILQIKARVQWFDGRSSSMAAAAVCAALGLIEAPAQENPANQPRLQLQRQ